MIDYGKIGPIDSVLELDFVIPERAGIVFTPEMDLMYVLLIDALKEYVNHRDEEAEEWIFSVEDQDYTYSFTSCVESLGWDVDYFRKRLKINLLDPEWKLRGFAHTIPDAIDKSKREPGEIKCGPFTY